MTAPPPAFSHAEATTTTVLHVDRSTVVIFSVLLSPALLMAGQLAWRGQQLWDAGLLCVAYIVALYWVCGRTVELAPGRLVYRVFFTRKDIELSRVRAARVVARPAPTLELMQPDSPDYAAAFIVKPFTRAGVTAILLHIRACSPDAELDHVALDVAEGRFDSITRETIAATRMLRRALVLGVALVLAVVIRLLLR
jgi:hypothetical protein